MSDPLKLVCISVNSYNLLAPDEDSGLAAELAAETEIWQVRFSSNRILEKTRKYVIFLSNLTHFPDEYFSAKPPALSSHPAVRPLLPGRPLKAAHQLPAPALDPALIPGPRCPPTGP